MKIIFSRKGFDSGTGGCPSPIFPDSSMMSLPIPGGRTPSSYKKIQSDNYGSIGPIVENLSKNKILSKFGAHLDPDLSYNALPRLKGWTPTMGQCSSSQSHLSAQGVGPGDIFLFFGWFRDVELKNGIWNYVPRSPERHIIFGYLQIAETMNIGAKPDVSKILDTHPWLFDHPHLMGEREKNNTIYVASKSLNLNFKTKDNKAYNAENIPGGSSFQYLNDSMFLTNPGSSKSIWKLPDFLDPHTIENKLSYHNDKTRWTRDEENNLFSIVSLRAKNLYLIVENQRNQNYGSMIN